MIISEVINKNALQVNMTAKNKQQALASLVNMLYQDGAVDNSELFIQDVYKRENEGMTGIGGYIAIPHGKSQHVNKTCIAIGLLNDPIEWESLDGNKVKAIILFAVSLQDKNDFCIKLMSKIARMLGNDAICSDLLNATTTDELIAIFDQKVSL